MGKKSPASGIMLVRGRIIFRTLCALFVASLTLVSTSRAQLVLNTWTPLPLFGNEWGTAVNWLLGLPLLSHSAHVASNTVSVSGTQTTGALVFTGGTITGSGRLILASTSENSQWTGGSLLGGGVLEIAPGVTLAISGAGGKIFAHGGQSSGGRTIENFGLITWAGTGGLLGGDGAQIQNKTGATFRALGDAALGHSGTGNTPSFVNDGTFEKTGGAGTTAIGTMTFATTGIVSAQSGTISFGSGSTLVSNGGTFTAGSTAVNVFSGTHTFNTGTTFTGAGQNRIAGGTTTFSGTLTADTLEFASGSANGTATFLGAGEKWTGGTWLGSGTFTFGIGNTLTIDGSAAKTLSHGGQSTGGRIVSISGAAFWEGAGSILGGDGAGIQVNNGGTFTMRNDAVFSYGGTGIQPFFTNAGTLVKADSFGLTTFDSVAMTNSGTLNVQTGTLFVTGGVGSFSNTGTVNVSTGARLELGTGGGTSTGTFNLAALAAATISTGTQTFGSGASILGNGVMEITGGALLVSGAATIGNVGGSPGNLLLASGVLGGNSTLTVQGPATFEWSGGDMTGSGTTHVAAGGLLELTGTAQKKFYHGGQSTGGRTISNAGTLRWTGTGSLLGGDGGHIINQPTGLFEVQAAALIGYSGTGNFPTITNQGILRKNTSGGTFTIASGTFNNTGTIETETGTLEIATGGTSSGTLATSSGATLLFSAPYTIAGGTLTGAGTARVASTVTFSGNTSLGDLTHSGLLELVSGGVLTGNALVTISGNGSVLDWKGGNMAGSGTTAVASGGTLLLTGATDRLFYHGGQSTGGRTLDNSGVVRWTGAGRLLGGDGALIENRVGGLFDIKVDSTLGYSGTGSGYVFNNAGTLRKSDGAGVSILNGGAFNNTGLAEVLFGTLRLGGGGTSTGGEFNVVGGTQLEFTAPYTLQNGSEISGSGTTLISNTTLTVSGTSSSKVSGVLQLPANSILTGTSTLDISGQLHWTGGSMLSSGTTNILPTGTLLLSGVDPKGLSHGGQSTGGRTLVNQGLARVTGTGSLLLGDAATIDNAVGATFELMSGAGLGYLGVGNHGGFNNSGLLTKNSTATGVTIANLTLTNQSTGHVKSETGTLTLAATVINQGGTFTALNGATLVFSGTKTFNGGSFLGAGDISIAAGATALSGAITSQNLSFDGGTMSGAATLHGMIGWTGGDFVGGSTLTLATSSILDISGTADKRLYHGGQSTGGRVIDSSASVLWSGDGRILLGDGAQFINRVSFLASNDTVMGYSGTGNTPSFTNHGVFTKLSGSGATTVEIPFVNHGSILVSSGTLRFSSTFSQNAGSVAVANGATARFEQGLVFTAGILAGDGTIHGNVASGGILSPGTAIGALTITGNLSLLATSNLLLELGGTAPGTGHDFLSVSGNGTLDGTLSLAFANGFQSSVTPAGTFTVLTAAGPLGGAFSNVVNGQRISTLDGFGSFQVNFGAGSLFAANSVVLSHFAAVPEPSTWALMVAGLGAIACAFRRRSRR